MHQTEMIKRDAREVSHSLACPVLSVQSRASSDTRTAPSDLGVTVSSTKSTKNGTATRKPAGNGQNGISTERKRAITADLIAFAISQKYSPQERAWCAFQFNYFPGVRSGQVKLGRLGAVSMMGSAASPNAGTRTAAPAKTRKPASNGTKPASKRTSKPASKRTSKPASKPASNGTSNGSPADMPASKTPAQV